VTATPARVAITVAVEGTVDEAVARVLITAAGAYVGPVYGREGKGKLHRRVQAYNETAKYFPWLVLLDLDTDADCPPPLIARLLPRAAPAMAFRIVVRAIEAWLLADREAIAQFLAVPVRTVPADPESLDNPKQALVQLAKSSKRRDIREDVVPREGSGREVGPGYTARATEFASAHWRPEAAAERSPSLRRCIMAVQRLVGLNRK
jgi:hypothetical protein